MDAILQVTTTPALEAVGINWDTPDPTTTRVRNTGGTKTKTYEGTGYFLYSGDVLLEFYEKLNRKSHCYLVNGQPVTSVSKITQMATPVSSLMWWAAGQARDYMRQRIFPDQKHSREYIDAALDGAYRAHDQKKTAAGDIGTVAHAFASRYIKARLIADRSADMIEGLIHEVREHWDEFLPVDDWPHVVNAINAFLQWEAKHDVTWLSTERPVYSRQHNYFGTMDWEAIIDGKLIAGDLKTSNAIREGYYLQVAAYAAAREEEGTALYDDGLILRLSKEPSDKAEMFEARYIGGRDEHERNFQAFLAAQTLQQRVTELGRAG